MIKICVIFFTVCLSLHSQQKIIIKGSDTLGSKMMPKLAEAFTNEFPGTHFEIAAEGTSTGISAIIDGTADIGMSSRDVKGRERASAGANGVRLYQTVVAMDAVVIIVNARNPLYKLSAKDLERIFTGDVTNWSSVGGRSGIISAYTRNTSSGTYSFFQREVLSNRDYGINTQKMVGNEQIVIEVANNPNAIGYAGLAFTQIKGIKTLEIEGDLPSANYHKPTNGLSRTLSCVTNGKPTGRIKDFLDFLTSAGGQKIISSTGFLSLPLARN